MRTVQAKISTGNLTEQKSVIIKAEGDRFLIVWEDKMIQLGFDSVADECGDEYARKFEDDRK